MYREIKSYVDYTNLVTNHPVVLVIFSTPQCNVCHSLKPKIVDILGKKYHGLILAEVNSGSYPDLPALNGIFTSPSVLVYFEGKEYIRKSRVISIDDLDGEISRLYRLLFDE